MTPEFQIIFTAVITLLAGLALFTLRGVMKRFDESTKALIIIQEKLSTHGEKIVAIETKIEMCPSCGKRDL